MGLASTERRSFALIIVDMALVFQDDGNGTLLTYAKKHHKKFNIGLLAKGRGFELSWPLKNRAVET
jgi:hypothetical protein